MPDRRTEPSRREFLQTAAVAGGGLGLGLAASGFVPVGAGGKVPDRAPVTDSRATAPRALSILILGGTGFLGPHHVRYALERGHTVSTFTRGRTEPRLFAEVFAQVEQLEGDRAGDLSALRGRTWDAVIDNSGSRVEWTRDSAALLRDSVGRYVYTSSTGVYLPYLGMDIAEETEVRLEDPPSGRGGERPPSFGVMKSLSEIEARTAFGADRTLVVRPTYIVGPGDTTNRFVYWPARLERGGEVLVPGKADDPIQIIDARDLTEWMVRSIEQELSGTFNVAGPASPMGMHAFVYGAHAATSSEVSWVLADDYDFLREQRISSLIPWIMPVGDYTGSARVNNRQAIAAGLTFRPLAETTRDTLTWWHSDAVDEERRVGLLDGERSMMQRERDTIAAWRAR